MILMESIKVRMKVLKSQSQRIGLRKRKNGTFEEVNKIFESKGYSGLRPVHLSFVKRYISYDAREEWLANKSLSDIVEKGEK